MEKQEDTQAARVDPNCSTCRWCLERFPSKDGVRNATQRDEFPYCSHECARAAYWLRDLSESLKTVRETQDEEAFDLDDNEAHPHWHSMTESQKDEAIRKAV